MFAGVAAVLLLSVGMGASATAAVPADQLGVHPSWQTSGAAGAFSLAASYTDSAAFPAVTGTSDSVTVRAPSGESAWLGASTGFGQEFGSSRSQPYLYLSTAAGQTASVSTLDFAAETPAGWGFALGDVDADWVYIRAFQGAGRTQELSPAQLGFRGAGNYCTNVPKPSSCATGPFTDAPVWVSAPETFDGIDYAPGTLRGNSMPGFPGATRDTAGAYGWFTPTVPVRSIEFTFGPRDGFPIVQLWLAALAPKTTIAGVVEIPDVAALPVPPLAVQLNDEDGTPVLDIEGNPVTIPVAPDGRFEVQTEQRDFYQIAVIPPPGYTAPAPVLVAADQATATVPPLAVAVNASTPTPGGDLAGSPSQAPLAATGVSADPWLITAGVLVVLGLAAFLVARRGRRRAGATPEDGAEPASETPENPGADHSISRDGR